MKLPQVEAVSSGQPSRSPHPPDDWKIGLLAIAVLLLVGIVADIWREQRYGPAELAQATTIVRGSGYRPTRMWRSRTALCERGSIGYRWESHDALGHVCLGVRDRLVVDQHFR
jgi:hypothetical protein